MDKIKEPGYVYILTNPSFREDWIKIVKVLVQLMYAQKNSTIQPYLCRLKYMLHLGL